MSQNESLGSFPRPFVFAIDGKDADERIETMRTSMRIIVVGMLAVFLIGIALALAVGQWGWGPAMWRGEAQRAQIEDAETALTAEPLILARFTAEERMGMGPSQELMADLYTAVLPSVVNIQVTSNIAAHRGLNIPDVGGQGSGWVWDTAGHIVTNHHVVANATDITVHFHNGLWAEAELVASAPQADLAVIRVDVIEGVVLRPLPLARLTPAVGHYALAFGSPFGLTGSMTRGIISAVGRAFPVGDTEMMGQYTLPEVIQTDAAINPGNSGGPLINLDGQVIGVNFAIRSEVRANAGVGFAIPGSIVARVVPALISEGVYHWPFLGIGGGSINPEVATQLALPAARLGVIVSSITRGGPAARAGVQPGDIVTAIDGRGVSTFEDLIGYLITETVPGQNVEMEILRGDELRTLSISVGARP
jgi:serine protease Do